MHRSEDDFRTFYLTRVGLGEGCGCAERVIDLFEAARSRRDPCCTPVSKPLPPAQRLRRLLAVAGLARRRRI